MTAAMDHGPAERRPIRATEWLRKFSLPSAGSFSSASLCQHGARRLSIASNIQIRDTERWPENPEIEASLSRDRLLSTSFDALSYNSNELLNVGLELFRQLDVLTELNVSEETIKKLLLRIRQHMPDNVYHNWWHCVDVAQATLSFGTLSGMFARMPSRFKFASMVAALCHDLDHPGLNQLAFCESNESVVALFGRGSLLERRHAFVAGQLLSSPELDLQAQLGTEVYLELLDNVSNSILATDMERHSEFHRCLSSSSALVDFRREMCFLLKFADLSNVARPHSVSRRWGWLISEEILTPPPQSPQLAPSSPSSASASSSSVCSPPASPRSIGRVELITSFLESVAISFFASAAEAYPSLAPLEAAARLNLRLWQATPEHHLSPRLLLSSLNNTHHPGASPSARHSTGTGTPSGSDDEHEHGPSEPPIKFKIVVAGPEAPVPVRPEGPAGPGSRAYVA